VIDSCISQAPVLDAFSFSRVLHNSIILYKSRRCHAKNRRAALNTLKEDTQDLFQHECASPSNAIASEPLWNGQTGWHEPRPRFFEYEQQLEPSERPDDSAEERLKVQLPQDCLQCLPNLKILPSDPIMDELDAAGSESLKSSVSLRIEGVVDGCTFSIQVPKDMRLKGPFERYAAMVSLQLSEINFFYKDLMLGDTDSAVKMNLQDGDVIICSRASSEPLSTRTQNETRPEYDYLPSLYADEELLSLYSTCPLQPPYLPDDDAAETQFSVSEVTITSQSTFFYDTAEKPSEGEDIGGAEVCVAGYNAHAQAGPCLRGLRSGPQLGMAREFSSCPRSPLFSPISEPEQDIAASLYCTWPAARDIDARDIDAQDIDAQDAGCASQRKSFLLIPPPMPPPLSPVIQPLALNSMGGVEFGSIENTPNYTADNSDDETVVDRMQNSYEGQKSGTAMGIQSLEIAERAVNEQSLPGVLQFQAYDENVAQDFMVSLTMDANEQEEASTEAAKEQAEEETIEEESEERSILVLLDPASIILVRGERGGGGGDSCARGADIGLDNQGRDKHDDGEGGVEDSREWDESLDETGGTTRNKGPKMRTSFARAKVYAVARQLHTYKAHAHTCKYMCTHSYIHTQHTKRVHVS
jgi:hypothetical protein